MIEVTIHSNTMLRTSSRDRAWSSTTVYLMHSFLFVLVLKPCYLDSFRYIYIKNERNIRKNYQENSQAFFISAIIGLTRSIMNIDNFEYGTSLARKQKKVCEDRWSGPKMTTNCFINHMYIFTVKVMNSYSVVS